MSSAVEDLIAQWNSDEDLDGEIVHVERTPARNAIFGEVNPPLHPLLAMRLAERGIEALYRHQVRVLTHVRAGDDVVMVAGTAAGKSLGYQIPIIESILADPTSSALLLFPTKALAQDQVRSLRSYRIPEIIAGTYDGDTPADERSRLRHKANVVFTNPDMVHVSMLPSHDQWADFLHRLDYVVVDEMHSLRGVFGTHVAMVLRRLRRLCHHYGSNPQFVFGSATIGNPRQLAEALGGKPVVVVDEDASPRGAQSIVLWNPSLIDDARNQRRSALSAATDLLCDLVERDRHTIVFTRSRKSTELIYRFVKDRLGEEVAVAPYRAGYLPEQRRRIEEKLFDGSLAGVIATNALELGIDVGGLDAAILTTFPGTISSFRQQSGRAGRRQAESVVALVAGEDALDQYFMTHPQELFSRAPEAVMVNPNNSFILQAHVACAAHELALTAQDRDWFGDEVEVAAAELVGQGVVKVKDGALYWSGRRRPASMVDIRSSGGANFTIFADGTTLGTLDQTRVYRDAHPGAIYLHEGETYLVDRLDIERCHVLVRRDRVGYYTQPKEDKDLTIIEDHATGWIGATGHHLGVVRVEARVVAYQRRSLRGRALIETVDLDLPPIVFETEAIWLTIPPEILDAAELDHHSLLGSLHAAEHAAIGMLPLLTVCDRWDVGGLSTDWHPQTGGSTIFVYEAYPGGAGISPEAFRLGAEHMRATVEAIRSCPCVSGCPSCVQSPKCGNFNEPLDKTGAIRLLDAILG